MGRKRKTRWRRLSMGGNSGNEEEEAERESESLGFSKMNPPSIRVRSGSQPAIVNSFSSSSGPFEHSPSSLPAMNGGGSGKYSSGGGGGASAGHSPPDHKSPSDDSGNHAPNPKVNGYSHSSSQNHHQHHDSSSHNGHRGDHHGSGGHGGHYGYNNGGYKESRGDGGGGYHSNGGSGYYPSSNYYHHRNGYNSGGGGSWRGNEGGGGYRGRGSGDYHGTSRFGGRFRKPRSYASNYYYNNGPSSSGGGGDEGNTNRPSYNQEEYTKITTPRQDVLFKKGYLSQRKTVTQASSVDSTSSPTTPSNGTPDTHSTNGLNSDYSEGYENGETECGLLPYDDTVYYGLPPETAVFTDPNTGQVYYGQSNGEYFDAYPLSPVMMAGGYPAPVYYHLPYPGMDWNGLPTPIYPIVPLGPPPLDDHHSTVQNGETQKGDGSTTSSVKSGSESSADPTVVTGKAGGRKGDGVTSTTPLTNGNHKNSKTNKKNAGEGGTLSDSSSSTSSREGSTSTLSSAASTPLSPPGSNGGQLVMTSLAMSMSSMSIEGHHQQAQQLQPLHPAGGLPPPIPVSHFLAAHTVPPPPQTHHHHHPHHHPQQILYHPHPATFVYAPPIYNGVVLPIAPVASSAESQCSPSSRKKRKLRRRKKDDGQLTDESSAEEDDDGIGPSDELSDPPPEELISTTNSTVTNLPPITSTITSTSSSSTPSSSGSSPSKSSSSQNATKKDLIVNDENCPQLPENANKDALLAKPISQNPSAPSNCSEIGPELIPAHPPAEETLLANKIVQSTQIPVAKDPETVKPEPEGSHSQSQADPQGEAETTNANPEETSSGGPSCAEQTSSSCKKKPAVLGLDLITAKEEGLEADEVSLSLEPSSPDSFNTTQSLAGSEIPSVSISETDFMNRTTSVDEVEEDLPPEDFGSTDLGSPLKKLKKSSPQSKSLESEEGQVERRHTFETEQLQESHDSPNLTRPQEDLDPLTPQSDAVPISALLQSFDSSPPVTPKETERSPSLEAIFERILEPSVLPGLKVETQETLDPEPLEPTEVLAEELCEIGDAIAIEAEFCQSRPSIATTVPQSPASDDVESISIQVPSLTFVDEIPVPTVTFTDELEEPVVTCVDGIQLPSVTYEDEVEEQSVTYVDASERGQSCSSPLDRPQSITLAVAEWLKVRGPDALTPVTQLQELFQELEQVGDNDSEEVDSEEDDDDSLSLTTEDLTKLDSSSGQPKTTPSPAAASNCCIQ